MVPFAFVWVHLTILNPASVLTDTELVIEPSVLVTAVPPAFQHHATYGSKLALYPAWVSTVKPSLSKLLNVVASVTSAEEAFE